MTSQPNSSRLVVPVRVEQDSGELAAVGDRFQVTHWSVVLQAGAGPSTAANEALETLCRSYWPPLFAYARRLGHSWADAEDLTQGFFAALLDRQSIRLADRDRGRFRTFLLTAFQHFIQKQWIRSKAAKRGGEFRWVSTEEFQAEGKSDPAVDAAVPPDLQYDQEWGRRVFAQAFAELRAEFRRYGKEKDFTELSRYLSQPATAENYAESAARLGAKPKSVAVAAHRMRHRFGQLLRSSIQHTVSRPEDVEEELRYLQQVMVAST